ncbi:HD-GYP domain-containing protein [Litchfieldia salsa]|uniref:HDIG domain-containing protein n=1 Tax=Litchfieldia salsa TaxID=930152 RepID=A0A1H0VZH8_9BACI|nr:HD-GYP domain-containing protein [Litchfieldia salsa]SDP83909.1 HDIG domain-containing protein [Litchfieldia salsa]
MLNIFNKWLDHPVYFRYGFYILLIISVFLNGVILQNDSHFFILYIFTVVFLGIGYYNKPAWFLTLLTLLVVKCRYFLITELDDNLLTFIIYLFTYLLFTFISAGFMRNLKKVKKDNIELTTALANALDSRDTYTLHHSENVAKYAEKIAKAMNLPNDLCNTVRMGSLLHDIGKIGIPENILTKPGKLTNDEYEFIKAHPKIGYEIIKHVEGFHKNGVLDIVLYHHERYDGKGYPFGLKGDDIPLISRIVAIADTFDAMTSRRIYREELDLEYTLNEINRNKGTQFDPDIVDVFLKLFSANQTSLVNEEINLKNSS